MSFFIVQVIHLVSRLLSLLIIVDAILSFLLSPFHPIREFIGKILQPLYNPIRRILPPVSGLDFSPLVLLIIVQVLEFVLVSLFSRIG
jgi:YggT family protein